MLPPALLPPFSALYRGRLLAAFSTFRFCYVSPKNGASVDKGICVAKKAYLGCTYPTHPLSKQCPCTCGSVEM